MIGGLTLRGGASLHVRAALTVWWHSWSQINMNVNTECHLSIESYKKIRQLNKDAHIKYQHITFITSMSSDMAQVTCLKTNMIWNNKKS